MATNTRERSEALQQAARSLLEERKIDITEPYDFRAVSYELKRRENVHIDTAKRHIATAARRMRGEITKRRGGRREGAGAKALHPEPIALTLAVGDLLLLSEQYRGNPVASASLIVQVSEAWQDEDFVSFRLLRRDDPEQTYVLSIERQEHVNAS